ncbi:TetR/AcrR family transcriptional regulator [Acetobacter tropicalis]|uniref:Putative transcriptional regulator, TetR family n=1 Tax=Acetobacter tropicalis TaxID=104102 RepID=A0A094YM48_9PROT|nr:TetR/AcrR family transcriptional regulator [Acetobacter tropicalis]KGB23130.1 putative transcriptional regulator, TetR family [Acetobacter tropicalis]
MWTPLARQQQDKLSEDSSAVPRKRGAYRASQKREMTKAFKQDALESAAWKVFSTIGFDAATIRDIVSVSAVSPGSFYNYYKTKDVIFDLLLIKIIKRVRNAILHSRCETDTLEEMLVKSQSAVLQELLSISGAPRFFELNQHHVRARLFIMPETSEMLDDLKKKLIQTVNMLHISPDRMNFIASTVLTTGLEALLYIAHNPFLDIQNVAKLSANMSAASIRAASAVSA